MEKYIQIFSRTSNEMRLIRYSPEREEKVNEWIKRGVLENWRYWDKNRLVVKQSGKGKSYKEILAEISRI